MTDALSALLIGLFLGAGERGTPGGGSLASGIEKETQEWHRQRIVRLTGPDGWLTLVGLHWLKEGRNRFGSAKDNDIVFPPNAPAQIGAFVLRDKTVTLELPPNAPLQKNGRSFQGGALHTDAEGEPDVLEVGTLRFHIIQRGERLGVRIKDSQAESRLKFRGIQTYPPNAGWRVEAHFEPTKEPRTIPVPTVLGTVEPMPSPGTVSFKIANKEYHLDPVLEPGSKQLFFIFADETNRGETYEAGRFLYTDMPRDGRVTLDFNRAINPPCAFSRYATCPLPPKQNRLPIRVEAGEKRYGNHP